MVRGLRREEATSPPSPVLLAILLLVGFPQSQSRGWNRAQATLEQDGVQASRTPVPSPVDVATLTWGPLTLSKPQWVLACMDL